MPGLIYPWTLQDTLVFQVLRLDIYGSMINANITAVHENKRYILHNDLYFHLNNYSTACANKLARHRQWHLENTYPIMIHRVVDAGVWRLVFIMKALCQVSHNQ